MVVIQDGPRWLLFQEPVRVFSVSDPAGVVAALREAATAVTRHNLHAAGFLSYEAAAAFDLAVHPAGPDDPPLLWLGLYEAVTELAALPPVEAGAAYALGTWQAGLDEAAYATAVGHIKASIAAGHTYQVNFTFPLRATFRGVPYALFYDLVGGQQASYAAYVDTGRHVICSVSPELFFRQDGDRLMARPMKGTARRGQTPAEDEANATWLRQSEKNRAENVMIVDMLRNDLGRVAEIGTVQVPELFTIERYPTLLQMTSTVTARTTAVFPEIMRALYPCASITGAPKVRTMQIIRELETGPRGVYTGAIGYLGPGRRAQFNVAIRTVTLDQARARATYGVGSGVVWDSEAGAEYAECLLKAKVLTAVQPAWALLESLLWTPESGYCLLARHVARLLASAAYFGFVVAETAVGEALAAEAARLTVASKVRVVVERDGRVQASAAPLTHLPEPTRLGLAGEPVQSDNIFLYHKTTQREVYEAAKAARPDCDEVILWNERGELTEATTANLVLKLDGTLWTPPVSCGLLAGTLRGELVASGQVGEKVLYREDLARAEQVYLLNSVRGWRVGKFLLQRDKGT